MWVQRRFRSTSTLAQSYEKFLLAHFGQPRMQCFFLRTTKTLIILRVFAGSICQKIRFLTLRLHSFYLIYEPAFSHSYVKRLKMQETVVFNTLHVILECPLMRCLGILHCLVLIVSLSHVRVLFSMFVLFCTLANGSFRVLLVSKGG